MSDEVMILKASSQEDNAAVTECLKEFISYGVDFNAGTSYSGLSYDFSYIRECDGLVVGMLSIRPDGGEVGNLGYAIRPTEQGKGYGKMLVLQALDLCEMLDVKCPEAVVDEANIPSIKVLLANGFSEKERKEAGGRKVIRFVHEDI